MRHHQEPLSEEQLLSNFTFNPHERRFQLINSALAKVLVDNRIGAKAPKNEGSSGWFVYPQQFIFLISTLDMPSELILRVYSELSPIEIDRCYFYIWMRKRSRLLRLKTPLTYDVFCSVDSYNMGKASYTIKLLQSDNKLGENLINIKNECSKIAILRNRDVVILDII